MGPYREIIYGAMLFLSACLGAALAAWLGFGIGGIDIEEAAPEAAVVSAPFGAAAGCVAWLLFRYTYLKSPRT